MKTAEDRAERTGELIRPGSTPLIAEEIAELEPVSGSRSRASHLLIPVAVMVLMIFAGLYITGDGEIMQGSGSTSVLWAVCAAVASAMILYGLPGSGSNGKALMGPVESMALVLKGSGGLIGMVILVVLAFALGQVSRALEMGPYVVGLLGTGWPPWWIPAMVFVVSCFVAFTLGSSWTAYAVLIPIAIPLAEGLGIPAGLMLGAVLSGGVFGDHASPLSDTSLISSMSAACDHVDHINTQLPYALILAGVTFVTYLVAGILM
jgi:Na+/H+ antiporter NhaC